MVFASVLAAGIGSRFGGSLPKQFIEINGVPVIVVTLREFVKNDRVKRVFVAMHPEWRDYFDEMLREYFPQTQLEKIEVVNGGKERVKSFTNVIDTIIGEYNPKDDDILIWHNAVSPFITQKTLRDVIDTADEYDFAMLTIPAVDTVYTSCDGEYIDGSLDRNILYSGQTPSACKMKILRSAFENFSKSGILESDITGISQIFTMAGYKGKMVRGNQTNFKITYESDLELAEALMKFRDESQT